MNGVTFQPRSPPDPSLDQRRAALFSPKSYIECSLNIQNEVNNHGLSFDSLKPNVSLVEEYPDFSLGTAGALLQIGSKRNENTAMWYEPLDKNKCLEQSNDPLACEPIAQLLPGISSKYSFLSYFNTKGITTPHTYFPSVANGCEFTGTLGKDVTDDPKLQRVWWARVGDNKSTGNQDVFHDTYDVNNKVQMLGCDEAQPAFANKIVKFWTGDAKLYIGGSPYTNSWEGEMLEAIVDPPDHSGGGDDAK